MKQVLENWTIDHVVYQALVMYGPDDLVMSWQLVYKGVNVSLLTYAQAEETLGLTREKINMVAQAIQDSIDRREGRK